MKQSKKQRLNNYQKENIHYWMPMMVYAWKEGLNYNQFKNLKDKQLSFDF